MYSVYILKSQRTGRYYIGQTNNLERRFQDHQRGKDHSSRCGVPWILVYREDYETRSEAIVRERSLKSMKKRWSIERFIHAAGWSSGSSQGS